MPTAPMRWATKLISDEGIEKFVNELENSNFTIQIKFELSEESDYTGKRIKLKKPYIVEELCIGCGICENKCPVEGKSAIEVLAKVGKGQKNYSR